MSLVANTVEGSIASGAVYDLVGVGFVVLFRASKVLSFCQGAFMVVGAFVFYDATTKWGIDFVPSLLLSAAVISLASTLIYFGVFSRLASRDAFATSVATIGLAGVVQAYAAIQFGTTPHTLTNVVSSRAYHLLGAAIPTADIVAVAAATILVVLLWVLLRATLVGRRMEAVADNGSLAIHLGVNAGRSSAVAWGIAGATAAVAGGIFALRASVDPVGLSNAGLFAFPAIILGGLDSIGGVVIGGLLVAGVQNAVQAAFGSGWVTIASFALMLGILGIRPSGFFGKPDVVRL